MRPSGRALREMISSGRLTKLIPMKDELTGAMETREISQAGPIAYTESTTQTKVFDEDANRCVMLQTDERHEQTVRIMLKRAERFQGMRKAGDVERTRIRHHALQRLLERRPVIIPVAVRVALQFPGNRMEMRRAFGHLMSMVQASALLHQFQRTHDDQGRILATRDDYELARRLLRRPLAHLLGSRISASARRFLVRLMTWATGQFTTTEAVQHEAYSDKTVRDWLHELNDAGGLESVEQRKGPKPAVWAVTAQAAALAADDGAELPSADSIFGDSDGSNPSGGDIAQAA